MVRIFGLLGLAVLVSVSPGQAADQIIKGVYLKSEKLCAKAKKESLQKVIEDGNMVLTDRGVDATEYNCAFVQVLKHPRMQNAWVATAFCEEPEIASPDVFTIVQREPKKLEISSLVEGNIDAGTEDGDAAAGETAVPPTTGENAGVPAPAESDGSAPADDAAAYTTIGGTYVLCDGVTMP